MSDEAPQFTDQQRAAITRRDVSLALSAGAGCGKTFVLTQRFLSHLQPAEDTHLSQLVAITFTEKAAREMRDRIRGECRRRLDECPQSEVQHWLGILYGLDAARISTIHAFCTRLLRSHAVEAGLDPRFAVADAAQTDALIDRSARDTLHRLLERQDEDAFAMVVQFGLDSSRSRLAELIHQRFRCDLNRLAEISRTQCAEEWPRLWQEIAVRRLTDFRSSAICEEVRRWLAEHQPIKACVMRDRCNSTMDLLRSAPDVGRDAASWLNQLRDFAKVLGGGGKSVWADPQEHDELQELFKTLRDQIDKCLDKVSFAADDVAQAAEFAERGSRLAVRAIADYEQLKKTLGRLDFDDLLLKTRDLLRDRPEVAKKLAQSIKLLMVDEFQDTDQVQADIIRYLSGPALKTGKLFLVGDAQQSIYRFRRADPNVFYALRHEIPEKGRLPLSTNFRSVPDVLNFVNHLFANRLGESFLKLTPSPEHQVSEKRRKEIGPVIEFLWATTDVDPPAGPDQGRPNVDALRKREAEWIARRVAEMIADERPTVRYKNSAGTVDLRPAKPGDIVVLFRTLSDAPDYEAALTKYGIDYYLVGGKTFFAQQEVFDLLNLCRWLDEPADEISLVGCLRSPFFNLSDDAIHGLKLHGKTLTRALSQPPPEWLSEADRQRIRFAGEVTAELRQLKDRLPPSELLRTALERTGYDAALLHEHLGERKVANLHKLIRRAEEFDDAAIFTLGDYVRELERSVVEQTEEALAATLPEAGDVVRLMTIHQAKGLEFPAVFVADMNRKGHPMAGGTVMHSKWGALLKPLPEFDKAPENLGLRIFYSEEEPAEAAELDRLLYVATTRAADRLILSAGMTPDLKADSSWMRLLEDQFHLDSGLPKHDALLGAMSGAGAGRGTVPEILLHRAPPPPPERKSTVEKQVPLRELAELLSNSAPEDFPDTAKVIAPAGESWSTISVSRLEELVATPKTAARKSTENIPDAESLVAADVLGTVIHRVLQRLDVRRPQTWPDLLASTLATAGLSPAEESAAATAASEMLERFVDSPVLASMAGAKTLLREVDFLLRWPLTSDRSSPRVLVSGQIDVLLEDSDGWHLFDYKTGHFPATASEAELLAPYAVQLGVYALAAERQLGRPLASLNLIAMRPQVRLLKFEWSETARDDLARQIDAAFRAGDVSPVNVIG